MLYDLTFGFFDILAGLCDRVGTFLFTPAQQSINEAADNVYMWFTQTSWQSFNWLRDIIALFISSLVRAPSYIVGNEPFIVWILGAGFVTFIIIWLVCKIIPLI